MGARSVSTMLGIALVGASGGWAIAKNDDAPAELARDRGVVTEPVSFQADAGVEARPILRIGGLTLRAWCTDHGPRTGSYLSVAAETAIDDAIIGSSFIQKIGPDHSAYTFVQPDFDRGYGPWDFLGSNPDKTAGTLNYSRPDGGQVTVVFLADQGTSQGDCFFGGTATSAPQR